MKNQPKNDQKSTKKSLKIHPKSINIARVGPPGCILGASWGPFGVFGHPGSLQGVSWARLGASCWPTWLQLGSQIEAKINQKLKQKSINF